MTETIQDTIERSVELPVGRQRAWAAITTPEQISQWFEGVWEFELQPGAPIHFDFGPEYGVHRGRVEAVEPMDRVVYLWTHEGKGWDASISIDDVPTTLIEFRLTDTADGTRLTVVESGFAALPGDIRENSLRDNTQGWEEQMGNVRTYLESQ
ncbi:MAG: SRPBCC domain-containing protein [Thermomicrobiales bacterium]|nr:SRPBCC domain-containing protein [Thermomicrobiales bacterium]